MRKAVMVFWPFLMLSLFAGCGADPEDQVIEDAIKELSNARRLMNSMSLKLETMVKSAEKSKKEGEDDWKISKGDLKSLEDPTKELRKVGERFVGVEERAKRYGEKLKKEERKALKQKYQGRIQATLKDVEKDYRRLVEAKEAAMALCDKENEVDEYLDEELRIALQEFESLTRQ